MFLLTTLTKGLLTEGGQGQGGQRDGGHKDHHLRGVITTPGPEGTGQGVMMSGGPLRTAVNKGHLIGVLVVKHAGSPRKHGLCVCGEGEIGVWLYGKKTGRRYPSAPTFLLPVLGLLPMTLVKPTGNQTPGNLGSTSSRGLLLGTDGDTEGGWRMDVDRGRASDPAVQMLGITALSPLSPANREMQCDTCFPMHQ